MSQSAGRTRWTRCNLYRHTRSEVVCTRPQEQEKLLLLNWLRNSRKFVNIFCVGWFAFKSKCTCTRLSAHIAKGRRNMAASFLLFYYRLAGFLFKWLHAALVSINGSLGRLVGVEWERRRASLVLFYVFFFSSFLYSSLLCVRTVCVTWESFITQEAWKRGERKNLGCCRLELTRRREREKKRGRSPLMKKILSALEYR